MATLIITLPRETADTATLYDYVLSPDGSTVGEQSRAPLALLPQANNATEVVALVPARELSWHQVQLPKGTLGRRWFQDGGTARLRAVLAGLLEDRLLEETQQLHFAIEPSPRVDAPVWVAVCSRDWLFAATQTLEQAGRPVSRIVPEFAPDALGDSLAVIGDESDAQLVFTARGGVTLWPLSAASVALLQWPAAAGIVAEPAVAAQAEQLFKRNVTLQQPAQRRLQASQSPWDLAQFELVNSNRARTWKSGSALLAALLRAPRWRAARIALLALLVINLAGLNAWAWRERSALKAQRLAITEVLSSTFPKVRVVVDAPAQMAREVAALQQASGTPTGRDLESLLSVVASVSAANAVPSAIDYAPGELRLKDLKLQPSDLSRLSMQLKPQGYGATLEEDRLAITPLATP